MDVADVVGVVVNNIVVGGLVALVEVDDLLAVVVVVDVLEEVDEIVQTPFMLSSAPHLFASRQRRNKNAAKDLLTWISEAATIVPLTTTGTSTALVCCFLTSQSRFTLAGAEADRKSVGRERV